MRSPPSYQPNDYTSSNPARPSRHSAHRPDSSSGKRFRNGVRHAMQKNSAEIGCVAARQGPQTGILEISLRASPQTRQSSGKTRWNRLGTKPRRRACQVLSSTCITPSGRTGEPKGLRSRLLEKTHLHYSNFSVQRNRGNDYPRKTARAACARTEITRAQRREVARLTSAVYE